MKKLLLKMALAVSGLLMAGNAYAVEYLSQEGWSITGCSEELTGEVSNNNSGPLARLIDGDLNTYYHSAYNNVPSTCTSAGHYHWFVINLGTSKTFYGLDYWRRHYDGATVNGQANTGKIYVSESAFTAFANHNEAKAYFDNAENVAAGTFSFDYSSDPNGAKSCYFDDAKTGQYVLVIVNSSHNGYLSGGEVKLHSNVDPTSRFTQAVASKKEIAQGMSLIADIVGVTAELPDAEVPSDISVDNWESKAAEVNAALISYIRAFDRKQITIKNVRRGNPYLTAVVTGNSVKFNTETAFTPDAVWSICSVDNGFKLYNRNTGYYIGTNMAPNINNTSAQVFVPAAHGEDSDFAIKLVGTSNGLNIDNQGNNLTSYNAADGGSSWLIESGVYGYDTPEVTTANAPKYYRLVNARWMYSMTSPCLGANGENKIGGGVGEEPSYSKANIPGMYWRVESTGNGDAVKLVNLTGYELTYTKVSQDSSNATLTDAGSDLYLIPQTAEQFADINGGYAICSQSAVEEGVGRNCLDASPNGRVKIDWNPTSEGRGHGDNGSLWYFILASNEEITAATTAYVQAVGDRYEKDNGLADALGQDSFEEVYESVPALTEESGVADANAYAIAIRNINEKVVSKFAETAETSTYMLKTVTGSSIPYVFNEVTTEGTHQTAAHAAANDLNNFWLFERQDDGNYKIRNANTKRYIGIDDENLYGKLPMSEEGAHSFIVGYNSEVPGFTFLESTHNANENYAIHHAGSDGRVVRWNAQSGTPASHWSLVALKECPVVLNYTSASGHVMAFSGMTVNTHESAADLKIKVTKRAQDSEVATMAIEPDSNGIYTLSAEDIDENGEIRLDVLGEGIYDVEVPAGMFVGADGMPAGAFSDSFSVSSDGTTTAIEDVEFVAPVRQGIYDLQGRKLSAPVKGINIINGKKVLVK